MARSPFQPQAMLLTMLLVLAGCTSMENAAEPGAPPTPQPGVARRVGLVLPLSAPDGSGTAALAMRNAAEMAVAEFGASSITLIVKDDLGTPQGATAAAQAAIGEGAEIVLGPLLAPSVTAAGAVTRGAGRPMIAFSSDAKVAAPGVYLLSFLPQNDVERIISYAAASLGRRSVAALIPETPYGLVAEQALAPAVAAAGGRIAVTERVGNDPSTLIAAASRLAAAVRAGEADIVFAPFDAGAMPTVARALAAAGLPPGSVTLVGTGIWDDPRIFAEPTLVGALYAAPDATGFQAFASRYRARFGTDPVRLATVAYDAATLATALAQTRGAAAFTTATLTDPAGFVGIDGAFRFRPDGTNERGLAVLSVTPQGGTMVEPAPRGFASRPGAQGPAP